MSRNTPPSASPLDPVELTLRLREGTRVRLTLDLLDEAGQTEQSATVVISAPTGKEVHEETVIFRGTDHLPSAPEESSPDETGKDPANAPVPHTWTAQPRKWTLPEILFGAGLLIYLLVHLLWLPDYPIYFFSDEALPTVLASDMVRDNLVYEEKTFLPTFFRNGRKFSLGATVYLNILPFLFFGKSVWVVRGTTVLITLLAAAGIGLILKEVFNLAYWWTGPLLLSIVPAWFLHSRTGFETAVASSFFAAFLYFYLLYRTRSARYLYHALIFGTLTFYSYVSGQLVMVAAGLGLLVSDFRYHWENRRVGFRGVGLLVLLALPYLRFQWTHPTAVLENLQETSSYLVADYTTLEKVQLFVREYLTGLSPLYWYFPNTIDIPRHTMNGYGNILWITLPFALIGLVMALKSVRSPAWRVILIGLVASPAGAAVSRLGVTRALFFVIPITILTGLGFDRTLAWVQTRWPWFSARRMAVGVFGLLAVGCLVQAGDAILNGPFWNTDYTMGGMQFGARQVFTEIRDVLKTQPGTKIKLSPDWANGVVELSRFFLPDPVPVEFEGLQNYTTHLLELDPNALYVIPFSEYIAAGESGKFNLHVERSILDPNGHPAFVLIRAEYVPNVRAIFDQEAEKRRELVNGTAKFEEGPIPVRFSALDMGEISNIFDGNIETLIRSASANPLVVEFYLPDVRPVNGMALNIGATLAQITVTLFPSTESKEPVVFSQEREGLINAPTVLIDFDETVPAQVIRVEILDLHQSEPGNVHLWDIQLH